MFFNTVPKLNINFQPRPRWGSPFALAFLVGAAAVFAMTVQSAWDSTAALQSQLDRQRRTTQNKSGNLQRLPSDVPSSSGLQASTRAINQSSLQAMTQLQVPWGLVLGELEQVKTKDVALLGLEAQGAARRLRLSAQSKSMARALQYLAALRALPHVESAELSSHEEKAVAGMTLLHFVVDVQWKAVP